MADKKISELNSAATVYDADDFALVQDGDTKQVNASAVKAYVKDGLIKSDVGLGNVDNTSDANKPVSTATQTALDLKQDAASAATLTGTQTLTNKTISGSTNTLSNIANSSLTNSSITLGSTSISLGGTASSITGLALTGGTVNNTAIGGTTASSGAFTTLSASSTVSGTGFSTYLASPPAIGGTTPAAGAFTTLSSTGNTTLGDASGDTLTINAGTTTFAQGTANGVLYLNGSKVATSGSGLVFDGNSLAIGGIPISSYANYKTLSVGGGTNGGVFDLKNSANTITGQIVGDSTGLTFDPQAGILVFKSQSLGEVGRWTGKGLLVGYTSDSSLSGMGNAIFSGSVGIGTSSPTTGFGGGLTLGTTSAGKSLIVYSSSSGNNGVVQFIDSNNTNALQIYGGTSECAIYSYSTRSFKIYTNNSASVIVDSPGNLGLGVTPYPQTGGGYGNGSYGKLQVAASSVSIPTGASDLPSGYSYGYYSGTQSQPSWLLLKGNYSNSTGKSGILLQDTFYDNGGYGGRYIQAVNQTLQFGRMFNGVIYSSNGTLQPDMTLDTSGRLLVGLTSIGVWGTRLHQSTDAGTTKWCTGPYETATNYIISASGTGGVYLSGTSATSWSAVSSDERLKNKVADIRNAILSVNKLNPLKFFYKNEPNEGVPRYGFFAQNVGEAIPDAMLMSPVKDKEFGDIYTYDASIINVYLVRAVQELHAEIELLKAKVN